MLIRKKRERTIKSNVDRCNGIMVIACIGFISKKAIVYVSSFCEWKKDQSTNIQAHEHVLKDVITYTV